MVLLGSQVNVSPECLVYVFLMDKKQIIAIKEDELVQLLFSCFLFFFLALSFVSHLFGLPSHVRSLLFSFNFSWSVYDKEEAGMIC